MNNGNVDWRGNFPAVVSPFTKDGEIDGAKFQANIDVLISEGIDGCVVSGSNGESWALKGEERLTLFRLAVDVADGRIPVIGGTGTIVTEDVVAWSKAAKDTGVSGVMVMPPYYCHPNRREVVAHFRMISDEARIPILIYNTNSTGINIDAGYCEPMADIEWVCGIKQSSPDYVDLEETVARVGEKIIVFTGMSAVRGLGCVLMGAEGFVSSFDPHVMGAEGVSLWRLADSGQLDEARRVQVRTMTLHKALSKIGTGPATMKAAMNILDRPGGYPRRPLLELTADEKDQVRTVLDSMGLLTSAHKEAAE